MKLRRENSNKDLLVKQFPRRHLIKGICCASILEAMSCVLTTHIPCKLLMMACIFTNQYKAFYCIVGILLSQDLLDQMITFSKLEHVRLVMA